MNCGLSRPIAKVKTEVTEAILKWMLLIYRRHLQAQIDINRWDGRVSEKLDILESLLND